MTKMHQSFNAFNVFNAMTLILILKQIIQIGFETGLFDSFMKSCTHENWGWSRFSVNKLYFGLFLRQSHII